MVEKTFIFLTSNLGARRRFSPESVNRIDVVITYPPLDAAAAVGKFLDLLKARLVHPSAARSSGGHQ